MSNYWNKIPEASKFCDNVIENIQNYKLYPEENFISLTKGILASTRLDSQNEQFTIENLKSFQEKINNDILWFGINHDPLIQPHGRAIAAKIFYAPQSEEYVLFVVTGYYNVTKFFKFKDIGIDSKNTIHEEHTIPPFDIEKTVIRIGFNKKEMDTDTASQFEHDIANAPEFVIKEIDYRFRKTSDPFTTITICIPIWLIIANPFSKKFLEVYAEEAAKKSLEIFKWIIDYIISKVNKIKNERVLIEYESPCRSCHYQFLIDTKNTSKIIKATELLYKAGNNSLYLYQNLQKYDVVKIVYKFDTMNEHWEPIYAVTKKLGIISDKPTLIALDKLPGLSIGGRWGS